MKVMLLQITEQGWLMSTITFHEYMEKYMSQTCHFGYASVSGVKYKEMKVGLILSHNMMSWTQGREKSREFRPDLMRPSTSHCWSASVGREKEAQALADSDKRQSQSWLSHCTDTGPLWSQSQLLIILLELHLQNLCGFYFLYVDAVDQMLPFSHVSLSWTKQRVDLSFWGTTWAQRSKRKEWTL